MRWTEILRRRYRGIQEEHRAIERGEDPRSIIPTALREFDKRAGHKRKILHLYGAATGEGKSIWKLHLMRAAASAGYRVLVLDMEDPEERTADREFSNATGINNAKMMAGELSDAEISRIGIALAETEEWSDNVEVFTGLRTADEAARLLDYQWEDGSTADLVEIDYLSALPHGKHGRERTISDFCWSVTEWCQKHDAAGIAFAQLVTEVSHRGMRMYEADKRRNPEGEPYIEGFKAFDASDLAWCTDAGKTAKELGFMFRPGRYLKRLGVSGAKDHVMEFNFPKKNFGSEGTIRVGFDGATARLYDLPEKDKKQ